MLGLVGCYLLRNQGIGLNIFLWTLLLFIVSIVLSRGEQGADRFSVSTFAAPLFFSALLAWRASGTLNLLAFICLFILVVRTIIPAECPLWLMSIGKACGLILGFLGRILVSLPRLAKQDLDWGEASERSVWRQTTSAISGFLLAAPMLVVFAALFSSADAIYKHQLMRLFQFNFEEISSNLLWILLLTWLSAGYLRTLLFEREKDGGSPTVSSTRTGGAIELNTALLSLNALFLSFVLVQVQYLFGGAEIVKSTPDLGYAEYARRGFFELVTAAVMVLPLLLFADWIYPSERRKRFFRLLSVSLIALLFVVMLSAGKRMRMYQMEYGLTELRFYVSAFMLLLFFVFIWFCLTVLRGKRLRFLPGSVVLSLLSVVLLHIVNPDAWIMRVNLDRALEGKAFDSAHAASLSADGLPVLAGRFSELNEAQQQELQKGIVPAKLLLRNWRAWNWSRQSAAEHLVKMKIDLSSPAIEEANAGGGRPRLERKTGPG